MPSRELRCCQLTILNVKYPRIDVSHHDSGSINMLAVLNCIILRFVWLTQQRLISVNGHTYGAVDDGSTYMPSLKTDILPMEQMESPLDESVAIKVLEMW